MTKTTVEFPKSAEEFAVSISSLLGVWLEPPEGQAMAISEPTLGRARPPYWSFKVVSAEKKYSVLVSDLSHLKDEDERMPRWKYDSIIAVAAAVILFSLISFFYGVVSIAALIWKAIVGD